MNNYTNIHDQDDDLKGMAPRLSKLSGNNPLKADNDYFESFTSKLQNRIDNYEEIKSEAPLLSNIPKYNPFEVPADYFDELPNLIQGQIIHDKPKTSILEWFILLIKPRFAIPVLTTVFMAVAGINYMNKNAEVPKAEMAEETSVEEQLYTIDESTIIETLAPDAETSNETTLQDDKSIENYLVDNNIDETEL